MKNADMPAMPIVMDNGHPFHESDVAFSNEKLTMGSTKREKAAMMAMQGFASLDINQLIRYSKASGELDTSKVIAKLAVECADALFDELEKSN